jgi:hypothetical protein
VHWMIVITCHGVLSLCASQCTAALMRLSTDF